MNRARIRDYVQAGLLAIRESPASADREALQYTIGRLKGVLDALEWETREAAMDEGDVVVLDGLLSNAASLIRDARAMVKR